MKSASDSDLRELGSLLLSDNLGGNTGHVLKHESEDQTGDTDIEQEAQTKENLLSVSAS